MITLETSLNETPFYLTIEGYVYGNRLNVEPDRITVENDDLSEKEIFKICMAIYDQIDKEEGEIYFELMEKAKEWGYSEICTDNKY